MIRVLTAAFWATLAVTAGWVAASAWDYETVRGLLGERDSRLVTTLLMGGTALLSGLLVFHHRRAGGGGDYWTTAELVYMLALFVSMFYGIYSFFGWFFYA